MIIQSKNVWISSQFSPAQIEMQDGKIVAIYPYNTKSVDVDYNEDKIIPGMIDIHCHGAYGFDTNDATQEGVRTWTKGLTQEGITAFCPTTVTQSKEVLTKAVANVAKVCEEGYEGAEILGIHFEGPYLNVKNKGAQPEQFIKVADVEEFKEYQKAAKGMIKLITMACENDVDHALTRYASTHGVVVSMGHSGATYDEAVMAVANGCTSMTHVFNGMSGFNHRQPAMVGAAMRLRNTFGEIICDGNHVDWNAVNVFVTSKGKDYAIMIDDALCAKGCEPGKYFLGGSEIEVAENGSAYLAGTTTLAGGTFKFNNGIKDVVEKALLPIEYAINMATINPARLLNVDDRKGKIQVGYDADLCILDYNYEVVQTYCKAKPMK